MLILTGGVFCGVECKVSVKKLQLVLKGFHGEVRQSVWHDNFVSNYSYLKSDVNEMSLPLLKPQGIPGRVGAALILFSGLLGNMHSFEGF